MSLIIILGLKRWKPRVLGILVAVIVSIGLSAFLNLADKGVSVIRVLPLGFPLPSFPIVEVSDLPILFAAALDMFIVAVGDTISTAAGFAA